MHGRVFEVDDSAILPRDLDLLQGIKHFYCWCSQIRIAHNKAIVGKGAFLHESGIHQDGLIKSPQTYQLLDPKDIGLEGYRLVIGKLSGKNALKERMNTLGIKLDEGNMKDFSRFFKDHAAKKKFITDEDITTLYERWKSD